MTARPAERGRAAGTFGAELVALARLAGPITVGQLAVMGSAVIDNVLAGHRGATVLGAVAVGAGLWILALMPVFGVLMAMQPIVSELDGAGRRQEAIPVFRQAVLAGLVIGVVMGLLLAFGGPALLGAFGTAPAIRPGAVAFLRAVAPGVPAVALFAASRGLSEGLSRTRPTMLIQIAGLVLLAPLGYALMYGVGSLPPLGARAAVRSRPRCRPGCNRSPTWCGCAGRAATGSTGRAGAGGRIRCCSGVCCGSARRSRCRSGWRSACSRRPA